MVIHNLTVYGFYFYFIANAWEFTIFYQQEGKKPFQVIIHNMCA